MIYWFHSKNDLFCFYWENRLSSRHRLAGFSAPMRKFRLAVLCMVLFLDKHGTQIGWTAQNYCQLFSQRTHKVEVIYPRPGATKSRKMCAYQPKKFSTFFLSSRKWKKKRFKATIGGEKSSKDNKNTECCSRWKEFAIERETWWDHKKS